METGVAKPGDNKSMIYPLVLECVGVALQIITIYFGGGNSFFKFYGFGLLIGYLFASEISGAHFNPAISLAIYLWEGKYKENRNYIIAVMLF